MTLPMELLWSQVKTLASAEYVKGDRTTEGVIISNSRAAFRETGRLPLRSDGEYVVVGKSHKLFRKG